MICENVYPNGVEVVEVMPTENAPKLLDIKGVESILLTCCMMFSNVPIFLNNKRVCQIFVNILK